MISVAVTAYNESQRGKGEWILACLKSVSAPDLVTEVVVVDDCSDDWPWLKELLQDKPKVKLFRNDCNLGVYRNKLRSIELCTSEWVQICDSDDTMEDAHFKRLSELSRDTKTLYCNSFGHTEFDFRELVGRHDLKAYIGLAGNNLFGCLFNHGNHFLHRSTFLSVLADADPTRRLLQAPQKDADDSTYVRRAHDGADSAFYNSRWLLAGNVMEIVPGLEYNHRHHQDSTSAYAAAPPEKELLPPLYFYELCRAADSALPRVTGVAKGRHNNLSWAVCQTNGQPMSISFHGLEVAPWPVISMRKFGHYGRFANQLFQYSFLRIYAEQHGLQVQIPPWVGQWLFGLEDLPITIALPPQGEVRPRTEDGKDILPPQPPGDEFCGKDFLGYGQVHTSWYRPHKEKIRGWFRHAPSVRRKHLPSAIEKLRAAGKTSIGIHLRGGDYGIMYFYTTPVVWCAEWLRKNWSRFDDPVVFLATEDASLVEQFAEHKPLLIEDLGIELWQHPYPEFIYHKDDVANPTPRGMDFYPEFYTLTQCDVLLISNSSFSFFAAMLNERLKECWRPHLPSQSFVQMDPWDSDVITHEWIKDYPTVDGLKGKRT